MRPQKRAQEHSIRGQKRPSKIRGQKRPSKAQSGVKKDPPKLNQVSKKTPQSSIRGQKRPSKAGFSSIPKKGAPENPEKGGSFSWGQF